MPCSRHSLFYGSLEKPPRSCISSGDKGTMRLFRRSILLFHQQHRCPDARSRTGRGRAGVGGMEEQMPVDYIAGAGRRLRCLPNLPPPSNCGGEKRDAKAVLGAGDRAVSLMARSRETSSQPAGMRDAPDDANSRLSLAATKPCCLFCVTG